MWRIHFGRRPAAGVVGMRGADGGPLNWAVFSRTRRAGVLHEAVALVGRILQPVTQLLDGHRPRQDVPLRRVTSQGPQDLPDDIRLDALSDDVEAQGVAKIHYRTHHGRREPG